MSRSSDEQEIRDAVVIRLRELFPTARIIHELNVGHGIRRVDVAAVTHDQIISVEIKSKKDKLDRLEGQLKQFAMCSHVVVAAVHQKFFEEYNHPNGNHGWKESDELREKSQGAAVWCYPKIDSPYTGKWEISRYDYRTPDTRQLLFLMWADELRAVAKAHGQHVTKRTPAYELHRLLWHNLTGDQIQRAACKMLRARKFHEADAPIVERPCLEVA